MRSAKVTRVAKSPRNRLLAALPAAELARLRPHLEPTPLPMLFMIEKANARVDSVYFVERGFVSVVAVGLRARAIEVGLIGNEGMTGASVALGDHRSPNETYVQSPGEGYRIAAAELKKAMQASVAIRALVLRYVQTFMVQTAQTAMCNGRANLHERLARWLLMAYDRIGENPLPITHDFLALMLGVRRPSVTEAVAALEGEGLIRAVRGTVTVIDRRGLERRAGASYGVPEAEYRRLIG